MLTMPHYIQNQQNVRSNKPCLLLDPAIPREGTRYGNPLYWSPLLQATETTEGGGKLSQFAKVKAIQLPLDAVE